MVARPTGTLRWAGTSGRGACASVKHPSVIERAAARSRGCCSKPAPHTRLLRILQNLPHTTQILSQSNNLRVFASVSIAQDSGRRRGLDGFVGKRRRLAYAIIALCSSKPALSSRIRAISTCRGLWKNGERKNFKQLAWGQKHVRGGRRERPAPGDTYPSPPLPPLDIPRRS